MKRIIITLAVFFTIGYASAQTDPKTTPPGNKQPDTTATNTQLKKETDLKTMDAVKTQDHEKITPKPKGTTKDTVKTRKRTRPANSTNRP
ncbi:MAG TPA: hypothetical protein VK623_11240 [Flavobacterium sp.]|nr:hypothetical protein [Flavobacterium sp.]